MTDDTLHDRTVRWVLGELTGDEAAAFEARLATDPALAAEAKELARTFALVGAGAVAAPPPELRARVLAAAATRPGRRRGRPALTHVLTALAATLALVLGIDGWQLRRQLELERALTVALEQPNVVHTFAMSGAGEGGGAIGRVALDLDAQKGALVMRRLPALDADRIYRLWAAVGDRTVPCGDFRAGPGGEAVAQFRVPVESYTEPVRRLFVTIEPAGAGDIPTGPEVMASV